MSPGILYLSDAAQGLFMLEGSTSRRAYGELREFGIVLNGQNAAMALARLRNAVEPARRSVREIFGVDITSDSKGAAKLDRIAEEIWFTGRNRHVGDPNLFATHFGALRYDAMGCLGMNLIFRSREVADHHSLWDAETCMEFLPFHKAAKCLLNRQGEPVVQNGSRPRATLMPTFGGSADWRTICQ